MAAAARDPATNRAGLRAPGGEGSRRSVRSPSGVRSAAAGGGWPTRQGRRSVHNGRLPVARPQKPRAGRDTALAASQTTRERIVQAAAEAFAERGYFGVNLTDVVEDLGLTKGALYFYFDCKDALVSEIVDRHFATSDNIAAEAQAAGAEHLDAVVLASHRLAEAYRADPIARAGSRLSVERNLVNTELPEPFVGWIERITKMLRAAKRAKQVRAEVDERSTAQLIVGCIYGIHNVSGYLSGRQDLHAQLDELWRLLLPSLRPAVPKSR